MVGKLPEVVSWLFTCALQFYLWGPLPALESWKVTHKMTPIGPNHLGISWGFQQVYFISTPMGSKSII